VPTHLSLEPFRPNNGAANFVESVRVNVITQDANHSMAITNRISHAHEPLGIRETPNPIKLAVF
jgi:hypothetical protein